jgi:hypothetical protein
VKTRRLLAACERFATFATLDFFATFVPEPDRVCAFFAMARG